jgi:tetratricopeptide (TPR) repeat protein
VPGNADVQVAVGVLHSLARQYERAAAAFRAALELRPQDYSLWNKLGATLANSSHSHEAIGAYQKALDLKPNYMRAWTNMGIAQVRVPSPLRLLVPHSQARLCTGFEVSKVLNHPPLSNAALRFRMLKRFQS